MSPDNGEGQQIKPINLRNGQDKESAPLLKDRVVVDGDEAESLSAPSALLQKLLTCLQDLGSLCKTWFKPALAAR